MWNQALVRELAVILVIKLAALFLIWQAFFSHPAGREITPRNMEQFLLEESSNTVPQRQLDNTTGVQDG